MSNAWKRFMHRALKRQWRKYEALAERCLASEAERDALQRQAEEIGRDLQVANQQVAASITVIADLIRPARRSTGKARRAHNPYCRVLNIVWGHWGLTRRF
jgi:hypothetical protein